MSIGNLLRDLNWFDRLRFFRFCFVFWLRLFYFSFRSRGRVGGARRLGHGLEVGCVGEDVNLEQFPRKPMARPVKRLWNIDAAAR